MRASCYASILIMYDVYTLIFSDILYSTDVQLFVNTIHLNLINFNHTFSPRLSLSLIIDQGFKGLVINYGEGGAIKWENRGSATFRLPPPPYQDRVKHFAPPF